MDISSAVNKVNARYEAAGREVGRRLPTIVAAEFTCLGNPTARCQNKVYLYSVKRQIANESLA